MTALLVLGTPFALLGAGTAYLITYHEYRRHVAHGSGARRAAARTALIAFVSLAMVLLLLGVLLPRMDL